jgi:hypothetical protein
LIQERVGNTLELVGIGKNFLNGTPAAQQLRDSIVSFIIVSFSDFSKRIMLTPWDEFGRVPSFQLYGIV